ncbi:WD40 repeat domain-containing protein [Pseudonocardia sediminis]|uniref:WD40 repeat domain-containing protein n=1 Tax=Pseudonocardia sediminis TaxID=1397368 RepID=UPI001029566E|nr:WD40 repeat domain-containing protein [Pseudonocardia sediminis]
MTAIAPSTPSTAVCASRRRGSTTQPPCRSEWVLRNTAPLHSEIMGTGSRSDGRPVSRDVVEVEARIAEALTSLAVPRRAGPVSVPPPGYVRRHLVEHAAAGGAMTDAVINPRTLPYLDPARVRPALVGVDPRVVRADVVRAWRQVSHAWLWEDPLTNADALQLALVAGGAEPDATAGRWSVAWAVAQTGPSSGDVVMRGSPLTSTAALVLPDRRPIAITGSSDNTVRVWDLDTGTPIGEPLTGHTDWVNAVAALVLPDERPIAITGSRDNTVRVWDLDTGTAIGEPLTGHTRSVAAVAALVLPDRRPIAITGSSDNTVRVWDLDTGTPIGEPLTGHTGWVRAVAALVLPDRRPIAITGSEDGTTRVWDLTSSGSSSEAPRRDDKATPRTIELLVAAVAALVLPDGRPIAITGSADATVRVWDLTTGTPIGEPLTGHTDWVNAVAALVLPDRRPIAITGSWDNTVRVWDLDTGTPIGEPLTGHTGHVAAVAALVLPDRRPIAITGSADATVRVWDLTTGTPIGEPLTGHTGTVSAVAALVLPDGRPIAITGSSDNTVRVWDLDTGTPIGEPLTGHTRPVEAVAALVLPDRRPIAITGSRDNTVRVWDLTTGTPIGEPLTGHTGPVLAVVLPDGRPVGVTGGWDGTVRMWDAATGAPVAPPLPVLAVPSALAVYMYDEELHVVVASAGLWAGLVFRGGRGWR